MMTANIFNIQNFSIHDGPGIRTVVFFKGCPLRCCWCSNPESQIIHTQILWNREACTRCGFCGKSCPTGSIVFSDSRFTFNHNTCDSCQICCSRCPNGALEYTGKKMTVEEVMAKVRKDKDFYEESGGGVTLSGGEILVWPEFAANLLIALHKEQIHTALETTGYAAEDTFQKVVSLADLLLFDLKHHDTVEHKKYTGVSNELILANMTWAVKNRIPVIARIPVIPDVNHSLEDARAFCILLHRIGVTQVNLLPFHQFGEKKYDLLQVDYPFKNTDALHAEDLCDYKEILTSNGFDVKL